MLSTAPACTALHYAAQHRMRDSVLCVRVSGGGLGSIFVFSSMLGSRCIVLLSVIFVFVLSCCLFVLCVLDVCSFLIVCPAILYRLSMDGVRVSVSVCPSCVRVSVSLTYFSIYHHERMSECPTHQNFDDDHT